jgi:hypothetical protein
MRACTIVAPDESCYLGVFREDDKLYAGYISNSGANKEWSIDYDEDFSFVENLNALYEIIELDFDNK